MLLRVRAPQNCHNPNPPFGFCWDFPTVGSGMHRAPVKACQWKQTALADDMAVTKLLSVGGLIIIKLLCCCRWTGQAAPACPSRAR